MYVACIMVVPCFCAVFFHLPAPSFRVLELGMPGSLRLCIIADCFSDPCLCACREIGVRLLCYFLDRGWAASARMVLTTLLKHAAPMASFRAVASAVTSCNGEQLGILHRAVRSGEVAAITEVLGWAVQHQTPLVWDAKGPRGLTPLHLLALTGCKSMLPPHALQPGTALEPSLAAMVLQTSPGVLACRLLTPVMWCPCMHACMHACDASKQAAPTRCIGCESDCLSSMSDRVAAGCFCLVCTVCQPS